MVNNALVNLDPEHLGRALLPGVTGNIVRQFGRWAINYVQNNPADIQEFGQQAYNWLIDNGGSLGNRAFEFADAMEERIRSTSFPEAVFAAAGGVSGGILAGPGGIAAGAAAGAQFARQIDTPENERTSKNSLRSEDNTTLDEIIPQNTMEGTSNNGNGGTKRPADGPPSGEPEAARVAGAGGTMNSVSKETPISMYPTLTYGLQETHTTILPWCGYISTTGMTHGVPNVLNIRMTQPHDMIATTVQGLAEGSAWAKDFYVVPYNNNATRDTATAANFPCVLDTGDPTEEQCSFWEFFRLQYEYYTVLGCEYEILIDNPGDQPGTECTVGWDFNAYSDTAGASGNITPNDQALSIMKQYKGIQWRTINCASNDNGKDNQIMIKGTYKPGQARRNIINDGDVKTWIATNNGGTAGSPTLKEFITLYFFRGELAYYKPANRILGVNMQIRLKYIVQFKDLRRNLRYPNTTDATITLSADLDCQQIPV